MKKMFYKLFLVMGASLFMLSCFESEDDGMPQSSCNVDSYINAYQAANDAFVANMTQSNCINLKNKAVALLNAIHNCDYYEDASSWEESVAAINAIDCSTLP